jgi:hypothetical protein
MRAPLKSSYGESGPDRGKVTGARVQKQYRTARSDARAASSFGVMDDFEIDLPPAALRIENY